MNTQIKNNLYSLGILTEQNNKGLTSVLDIRKVLAGRDISRIGAIPDGFCKEDTLEFTVSLPRRAGLCRVTLVIAADGGENFSYDFTLSSDYVLDTFTLCKKVNELPEGLQNGLYYYHIELCFGEFILYTESENNVDITLSESYPIFRQRLLIYDKDFKTPDWFCGNIMYHVFVDRFYKGSVPTKKNEYAVINPNWDNGIPQYGEYPGAFVENNVFFGGTLWGISEKLDYLKNLGVGCIYLSPIFKAYSNHKYDTGDYMTVDEMLGGKEALENLIRECRRYDIKIVIDGVFNHTGDDSIYFNRYGRYDSLGAFQSEKSPFRDWYFFGEDGKYKCWWGVEILPKLNLENESCKKFFLGRDGVIEKYLDMGIGGIRLDVADELPDEFLEDLRETVRRKNSDGLIIGEVWENAADKIAYGKRRRYFRGSQLDSVMNYPFKNAAISFVKHGDARLFYNTLTNLYSSYPKQCCDVLMNILGTHDTERILTELGGVPSDGLTNEQLSLKRMTRSERARAVKMLKVASVLQYTVYGTPSVFYGDEAGLEGYHDPFCRMPFPWSKLDTELLEHYTRLGRIRRSESVFKKGEFEFCSVSDSFVAYRRYDSACSILVLANTGSKSQAYELCGEYKDLMSEKNAEGKISVPPMSAMILKKTNVKDGENNE